jgi:hypothetical protein
LEHLTTLLERAAETSIDLSITHPDDTMQDMIQLAASHSRQIHSLAVVLDNPDFRLPSMDLPLLENFQVHSQSMNETVEDVLKMIDSRAPELRSLCFEIHSSSNLPLTEVARLQCFYRLHTLYFATGIWFICITTWFANIIDRLKRTSGRFSASARSSRVEDIDDSRKAMDTGLYDFTKARHSSHSSWYEETKP